MSLMSSLFNHRPRAFKIGLGLIFGSAMLFDVGVLCYAAWLTLHPHPPPAMIEKLPVTNATGTPGAPADAEAVASSMNCVALKINELIDVVNEMQQSTVPTFRHVTRDDGYIPNTNIRRCDNPDHASFGIHTHHPGWRLYDYSPGPDAASTQP